jgi:hypothetical protein
LKFEVDPNGFVYCKTALQKSLEQAGAFTTNLFTAVMDGVSQNKNKPVGTFSLFISLLIFFAAK